MRIGIVDADLLGRDRHRFPNLVCEKLSGYWKERGADVLLLPDYSSMDQFDEVYISKVFTDTPFPEEIRETDRIHLGGTGFYFDKAPNLPPEIEHHMPDYHLYDQFIEGQIRGGQSRSQFREYLDYSIGFLTRGCFRKCGFCVNKKYDHVFQHSTLGEFYDSGRKRICLLDDNFLGCRYWKELLWELQITDKPFKFKQGLDERLLTDEKCEWLFRSKYDGDFTFAFDSIRDYDLIERKLRMIRNHTDRQMMFYVLVGYEGTDISDIENAFRRIELLLQYGCLPYIMRYQNKNDIPWRRSEWQYIYTNLARWCNQPAILKKKSFREFCYEVDQPLHKNETTFSKELKRLEREYPDLRKFLDMKFSSPEKGLLLRSS